MARASGNGLTMDYVALKYITNPKMEHYWLRSDLVDSTYYQNTYLASWACSCGVAGWHTFDVRSLERKYRAHYKKAHAR